MQMDGSDKVKQREMTERWAAKNNREDKERKLIQTDRYRLGQHCEAIQMDNVSTKT